jgi:hypothetical protein
MRMALTLSERMARIRKTDTKPEMLVRRILHALGYRYRPHRRDLQGNPNVVFVSRPQDSSSFMSAFGTTIGRTSSDHIIPTPAD